MSVSSTNLTLDLWIENPFDFSHVFAPPRSSTEQWCSETDARKWIKLPNLVEIGRGCPEGFTFNWLNTSEIRDFITKSFSSINIFLQDIFLCKIQIVEESFGCTGSILAWYVGFHWELSVALARDSGSRYRGNFGLYNPRSSKFLLWNPKS